MNREGSSSLLGATAKGVGRSTRTAIHRKTCTRSKSRRLERHHWSKQLRLEILSATVTSPFSARKKHPVLSLVKTAGRVSRVLHKLTRQAATSGILKKSV